MPNGTKYLKFSNCFFNYQLHYIVCVIDQWQNYWIVTFWSAAVGLLFISLTDSLKYLHGAFHKIKNSKWVQCSASKLSSKYALHFEGYGSVFQLYQQL
jgi:hypothetical protein